MIDPHEQPMLRLGDAASMSLAASFILTAAAAVLPEAGGAAPASARSRNTCGDCPWDAWRRAVYAALTQAGTALSDHAVETRVLHARGHADPCQGDTGGCSQEGDGSEVERILARRDRLASALAGRLDEAREQIRESRSRLAAPRSTPAG